MDICYNNQAVEAVMKELNQRYPSHQITVVCGYQKEKDMTGVLHLLANTQQISSIYPVTSPHRKVSTIRELENKIQEIINHYLSFERPQAFQHPISDGCIEDTLNYVLM